MSYYLRSKRLDIATEDALVFVLNADTAVKYGLCAGDRVHMCWKDICVFGSIDVTGTYVGYDEIGLYEDIWLKYGIPSNDMVTIDIISKTHAVEAIKKKLLGGVLSFKEINTIMHGIATRKLSTVEITYFAASSFSPGFNEQEIYYLTKAMAENGEELDFRYLKKKIVDKHSIGGIPAKGVTPVLVPILACFDLIVPNTSSRAITTPAGTSDILEVMMPVALSKEQIVKTVEKTGACLAWGGGIDLAPADDVLINIERPLHIEAYDKFIVSIMAKKVATGIEYMLVDLPVGKGTKIEHPEDVPIVAASFKKLGQLFDINVDIYERRPKGPDGYGVGPVLECVDLMRVFEQHPQRPLNIENTALDMAGRILEMTKTVPAGQGFNLAKEKLLNGEAKKKFWEIAFAQGATREMNSNDFILGDYKQTFRAVKSGTVKFISNKMVVLSARMLGAPFVKQAGIHFENLVGDKVEEGQVLFTLYATSQKRINLAKRYLEQELASMVEIE